jgi:site-specific DNA recombinase
VNRGTTIEKDPERFETIRQVFQWILAEEKTPSQCLAELNRRGYTMKRYGKVGGGRMAPATLYNILSNIFYAGYFVRAGETFRGAHEPMLTLSEFFRVQALLKRRNTRQRKHLFAYRGLITCGDCGCQVVGEYKRNVMVSGKVHHYTYYSCSNAKGGCRRIVMREEEITRQIADVLDAIWMPEEFLAFTDRAIARWKEEALTEHHAAKAAHDAALAELETKRTKLLDLRLSELLSDEEYREEKARMTNEIAKARMAQQIGHEATDELWESIENAVSLLHYGKDLFASTLPAVQNRIAATIGAKFVLTQGSLAIELNPVFGKVYELKKSQEIGSHSLDSAQASPESALLHESVRGGSGCCGCRQAVSCRL